MSKLQTTMSSLSYIDQMSFHIQEDRKVEQQVLFMHWHSDIPQQYFDTLKTKISHKYHGSYQSYNYQTYKDLLKLNLKNQIVCLIFIPYEDRTWARKFCSNQQLSQGFRMFIVTEKEDQFQRGQRYNSMGTKTILFPNDIESISTQTYFLCQKLSGNQQICRVFPTYFQPYSNNKTLTIFLSTDLVRGFRSQGKKILKSRQQQNLEIRQFKNIEQLINKVRKDYNSRKKSQIKIDQLIIQQCQNRKLTHQQLLYLSRSKQLQLRNLIFIQKLHPQLEIIKQFALNDQYRRWEIIIIDQRQSFCDRIPNQYADEPYIQDYIPELVQIIKSSQLYLIVHYHDNQIIHQIKDLNKMNCQNKLVGFSNEKDLSQILSALKTKTTSYGVIIISEEIYKEFKVIIRSFIDTKYPIMNLKILFKQPVTQIKGMLNSQTSLILGQQNHFSSNQQWISPNFIANKNSTLLQTIIESRCSYFYPAYGLEDKKIVLLVDFHHTQLVALAQQISKKHLRRISVEYWNGLEHVKYILSKLKSDEWGLVFVYENNLKVTVDILNFQSQLIVVGNNYKKYSHYKILKQGSQKQIAWFFDLLPIQQPNSILSSNSSLQMYNDSQLVIQSLKRFDFDENIQSVQQENKGKLIVVRLPLGIDTQNTDLLESRLIQKLKQNVVIKYYGTTGQIRDMGQRWQQKHQYLIITDDYLQWAQGFAKRQINQRFEVILKTQQNVQELQKYVTKANLLRFKLITNRWSQIQAYITRDSEFALQSDQNIEIILSSNDKELEQMLHKSPLITRTFFKYYDDYKQTSVKQLIKQAYFKHLIIVIINENNTLEISEKRVIQQIQRSNPSGRTLLISNNRISKLSRTLTSARNLQQAASWINKIKVNKTATGSVKVIKLK